MLVAQLMMMIEMSEAIIAYSIDVAPIASAANCLTADRAASE